MRERDRSWHDGLNNAGGASRRDRPSYSSSGPSFTRAPPSTTTTAVPSSYPPPTAPPFAPPAYQPLPMSPTNISSRLDDLNDQISTQAEKINRMKLVHVAPMLEDPSELAVRGASMRGGGTGGGWEAHKVSSREFGGVRGATGMPTMAKPTTASTRLDYSTESLPPLNVTASGHLTDTITSIASATAAQADAAVAAAIKVPSLYEEVLRPMTTKGRTPRQTLSLSDDIQIWPPEGGKAPAPPPPAAAARRTYDPVLTMEDPFASSAGGLLLLQQQLGTILRSALRSSRTYLLHYILWSSRGRLRQRSRRRRASTSLLHRALCLHQPSIAAAKALQPPRAARPRPRRLHRDRDPRFLRNRSKRGSNRLL